MEWIRRILARDASYFEGYNDGWQAAAKANYQRQERRRRHNPATCEYCRPKPPCKCLEKN